VSCWKYYFDCAIKRLKRKIKWLRGKNMGDLMALIPVEVLVTNLMERYLTLNDLVSLSETCRAMRCLTRRSRAAILIQRWYLGHVGPLVRRGFSFTAGAEQPPGFRRFRVTLLNRLTALDPLALYAVQRNGARIWWPRGPSAGRPGVAGVPPASCLYIRHTGHADNDVMKNYETCEYVYLYGERAFRDEWDHLVTRMPWMSGIILFGDERDETKKVGGDALKMEENREVTERLREHPHWLLEISRPERRWRLLDMEWHPWCLADDGGLRYFDVKKHNDWRWGKHRVIRRGRF